MLQSREKSNKIKILLSLIEMRERERREKNLLSPLSLCSIRERTFCGLIMISLVTVSQNKNSWIR